MGKEILKKIYKQIKDHQEIVIARHIGPDPDAIASQTALRDSIRLTFPQKKVYAVGISVAKFKYFGILDRIDDSLLVNPLLIVLDVPNTARIDGVNLEKYPDIIKIDHHPYEENFASIDYTDQKVSSTCELIYRLIDSTALKMDESIAKNIFLGTVSDSDRFLLSTTSYETLGICSNLIKQYNLNINELYNHLYERPFNEFKFQAWITLNMTVTENGLGYIKIANDIIKEYGFDGTSVSNMVNNFNFIKEIIAWAFISYDEKIEMYKANIRSRGPVINEVAAKFNGGGHKFASGARIKNPDDIDLLLKELDDACKEYQKQV